MQILSLTAHFIWQIVARNIQYAIPNASVILARNETRLARNETRGGNLLLSGTVFQSII